MKVFIINVKCYDDNSCDSNINDYHNDNVNDGSGDDNDDQTMNAYIHIRGWILDFVL